LTEKKSFLDITGGPILDEYQFLQFHMHWGSNENEGSEHVIDGIRSPAELHIVTWNTTRYKTAQDAILSERFGGIMIFAVLVEVDSKEKNQILFIESIF